MPRKNAAQGREQAAHNTQMMLAIGQGLKEAYDVRPLPNRLLLLMKKVGEPTSDSDSET